MASKKITGMTEALSLEDTDLLTGVDLSAPADSDKNVKLTKSALGFAADDDPRLSDSRAPTSHAASHEDGGSDELALAAAQITDFQTAVGQNPTLVTVDAQKHTHSNKGALDKVRDDLAGDAWLDNSGAYSVPAGGGTSDIADLTDVASVAGLIAVTNGAGGVNLETKPAGGTGTPQDLNQGTHTGTTLELTISDGGQPTTLPAATGSLAGLMTSTEQVKLAGIEDGATGDQTAAEIKTAYESNADTNAFTDAEQTKVANALTSIPANVALNGYTELGTNLGAPAGTVTIPVDGKLYEFNAALTVDLVITVGTKPTAPTCASSVIYVKPGGNTVTFSGVDYWAGGEMPTIGTVMRYVISTTVTGDVLADGEAFEALP